MRTHHLSAAAAIAASLFAGQALAEPEVFTDLGEIQPGVMSNFIGVATPNVVWFKFSIPEVSPCAMRNLDIDLGLSNFDSEFAVYDHRGRRWVEDDDDGPGTGSALSFGSPTPLRDNPDGWRDGDGRDGPLPAGVYWLVVSEFNTIFEDENWSVINTAEGLGGGGELSFRMTTGDPLSPPSGTAVETLCAGDVGETVPTAGQPQGSGAMLEINGRLYRTQDVDMFKVCIVDAAGFSADTFTNTTFDTVLWVFDANGRGVAYNNDAPESVQSRVDSTHIAPLGNGTYYIAVSGYGRTPFDSTNQSLWALSDGPPDGPGALNPVDSWQGEFLYAMGDYTISMNGVAFCAPDSPCGSADFDGDGDTGTDLDIEAFFACLGGSCCATCGSADFDGDGDTGTDLDIEAFFRVLGGGDC